MLCYAWECQYCYCIKFSNFVLVLAIILFYHKYTSAERACGLGLSGLAKREIVIECNKFS